jgi:predicted ferric reductase
MLLHAILLLFDRKVGFDVADILIPGMSAYRPQSVALGVLALYLLALVTFGYYVKDLVKSNWWTIAHRLVPVAWAMATLHGLWAGTDSDLLWAKAVYWCGVAVVSFFGLLRLLAYQEDDQRLQMPKERAQG